MKLRWQTIFLSARLVLSKAPTVGIGVERKVWTSKHILS